MNKKLNKNGKQTAPNKPFIQINSKLAIIVKKKNLETKDQQQKNNVKSINKNKQTKVNKLSKQNLGNKV